LNQKDTKTLNRSVISKEIKTVIKNLPTKKVPGAERFTAEFYLIFKELITMTFKLFHKIDR
jgi:hypothetical protein